jgi:oligoribonuclease (3'-5' exoribonuclease)
MNTAEQFVSLVLLARDVAHLAHWKTKSYAEHKALNEFYDEVLELIDGFVEQYQGAYGNRMAIKRSEDDGKGTVREVLEYQADWIEMKRYSICGKDDTALQNTIDEILRQYQSTLYMLTLE